MSMTAVTVAVQDPTGQIWAEGEISYRLAASKPVFFNDVELTDNYFETTTIELDSSGSATFNLPDCLQLRPAGTTWQITVNPNAYTKGITLYLFITGGSENISAAVNAAIAQPIVIPATIPFAYRDTNIQLQVGIAELYYNTGEEVGFRYYDGTAWQPLVSEGVTKIIAGTNINISPSSGVGDVTINSTGGGITQLHDDVEAGPGSGDVAATVRAVHAVNGTQLLTIDHSLGQLELFYSDSANNTAYSLTESSPDPDGTISPVFTLSNTAVFSGIQETAFIYLEQGLMFVDNGGNSWNENNGGAFSFTDNAFATIAPFNHTINLLTPGVDFAGSDNSEIFADTTNPSPSGGTQNEVYLNFSRNNRMAKFWVENVFCLHSILQSGGTIPITGGVVDLSSGYTLAKLPAGTVNTITPPQAVDSVFLNASAVVYFYADGAFNTTNSGNIVSTPFTAVVGNLYMGLYYGGTGGHGGSPGVWRIFGLENPSLSQAPSVTDVTGSRTFGTQFQNTSTQKMMVSGYGLTSISSTGTVTVAIGPSSASLTIFSNTNTASVSGGRAAFNFLVPPGWFYEVTDSGDITGLGLWTETLFS